jgi:hypothetical protein
MNFTKTKDIAADIFRMIRQIYENQSVSPLEKDLLKEKLRRLYEAIDELDMSENAGDDETDNEVEETDSNNHQTLEPPAASIETVSELVTMMPEIDFTQPLSKENTDKLVQENAAELPKVPAEPLIAKIIENPQVHLRSKEEAPAAETNSKERIVEERLAPVESFTAPEYKVSTPPAAPVVQVEKSMPAYEFNEEIEELFVFNEAKELLEKLRQTPIQDISKAFTLNERMLYAKELFGNNSEQMTQVLQKLNQLRSFEEARAVLVDEVIYNFGWVSKEKKKMAKEVIQVIKRRYLQS